MEDKIFYLEEHLPFWKQLAQSEKDVLIEKSAIVGYGIGEVVHSRNTECTGLLVVIEGEFRSYIAAPTGREITLFTLLERDICMLSASCAFSNITYDISLSATKSSKAILIESAAFKEVAQKNSLVLEFLLHITQSKLSDVMYTLEQAVFFPLDYRIASFLYEQYLSKNDTSLALTHEIIANHLGSAREVVSRILKKFEEEGLIRRSRGKVELLEVHTLQEKYLKKF